jgi:hypothetical protein
MKYFVAAVAVLALYAAVVATIALNTPASLGALPIPSANNQASFSGSKTQPLFTLGSLSSSTSTVTTTVNLSKGLSWGLALGDQCGTQLSSATSSLGFSMDSYITAINATSATATVTFWNGASSSVTIATGTLKVICNHF